MTQDLTFARADILHLSPLHLGGTREVRRSVIQLRRLLESGD